MLHVCFSLMCCSCCLLYSSGCCLLYTSVLLFVSALLWMLLNVIWFTPLSCFCFPFLLGHFAACSIAFSCSLLFVVCFLSCCYLFLELLVSGVVVCFLSQVLFVSWAVLCFLSCCCCLFHLHTFVACCFFVVNLRVMFVVYINFFVLVTVLEPMIIFVMGYLSYILADMFEFSGIVRSAVW